MSRAPLSLAVVSAVLVASAAVLLLAIVPNEVVTSRTSGPSADGPARLTGAGGGGGGHSRQLDVDPIEKPFENLTAVAPDEPAGLDKRDLNKTSYSYKKELVASIADVLGNHKFLDQYFFRSVMVDYLDPRGQYVILVPDDAAMERANERRRRVLSGPRDTWLSFHVLEGRLEDLYLYDEYPILETFNRRRVTLNWHLDNEYLLANNALVTEGYQKENIAILTIDDLLEPPENNFWQAVSKSPKLSKLTSLVRKFKLTKILKNVEYQPKGITLFAPSNEAFEQLDKKQLEFLERDPHAIEKLIWRHMSVPAMYRASAYFSNQTDWVNGPRLRIWNQLGEEMFVEAPKSDLPHYELQFKVGGLDLPFDYEQTTGGVMYIIDGFL